MTTYGHKGKLTFSRHFSVVTLHLHSHQRTRPLSRIGGTRSSDSRRCGANVHGRVLSMVYVGSSAKDVTSPLIRRPSVKYVPDWFPGAEFKKRAKEGYGIARDMLNKPYDLAKQRYVSLQCHPSFAARFENSCFDSWKGKAILARYQSSYRIIWISMAILRRRMS